MKKRKIVFTKDLDVESKNASLNSNTKALKDLAEVEKEKLAVKDRVEISMKEYNELIGIKNYALPFLEALGRVFDIEKLKHINISSLSVNVCDNPINFTEVYRIIFECDKHIL
jgi:hypothetical protein